MATALEIEPQSQIDSRFVVHGVDWNTYEAILEAFGDHGPRVTFDGGNLELMSPSPIHEFYRRIFGRLLEALAVESSIEIRGGGSMTFRRRDIERGLEPDGCYWIQNEPAVRGKQDIDLSVDPPPDLAIEIDITHSSLDRLAIYARLGIPEIWRFDGESLSIHLLKQGAYGEAKQSLCLPWLPVEEMLPFLKPNQQTGDTTTVRRFVAQVRRRFSQG